LVGIGITLFYDSKEARQAEIDSKDIKELLNEGDESPERINDSTATETDPEIEC
jgi:hypothetical protein